MKMRLFHLTILLPVALALLLACQVAKCQDEEDDDEDYDQNHSSEEDATNNYINNLDESPFGSGESSEHIDELSGGMFGESDSESDPIDWMDSKRRQSFVRRNFPFFFRRGKDDDDTIIQNDPGSYVKQDDQESFSSGNGNIQHVGDDIHSTGSGGEGGCSGGCDNDHHHHDHDDHDHHDHHQHSRHSPGDEGHFDDNSHSGGASFDDEHHRSDRQSRRKQRNNFRQFDERDDKRSNFASGLYNRDRNLPIADRMQRSSGMTRFPQAIDAYDPEKRSRYSGYDSKDKMQGGFTPMIHKSTSDHMSLSHFNDPFQHQFESALSPDPHNTFPRGSFYGLDGFYGNSKLMRDKLLSPYSLRTTSRKSPCDSGCDYDEDKKKKK